MKKTINTVSAAIADIIALSVGMRELDRNALEHILNESGASGPPKAGWNLIKHATVLSAFTALCEITVPIVI
jgi:hypothetical protein